MPTIITPTVGRKVWYRPSDENRSAMSISLDDQPLDATIIAVWNDRLVNVLVTDIAGKQFPVLSCKLLQEGDPVPPLNASGKSIGRYVEWMPYQTGLAAKQSAAA